MAWTGTPVATEEASDSYMTLVEAAAIAATLPTLTAYAAATDAKKAAAIYLASLDVDSVRFQGRKVDWAQVREFPRYSGGLRATERRSDGATQGEDAEIWDWDAEAEAAVVPDQVKIAVLLQANDILDGQRDSRIQGIADGLAAQSVGSLSESYRGDAAPARLCERAMRLLERYRLRSGQLL